VKLKQKQANIIKTGHFTDYEKRSSLGKEQREERQQQYTATLSLVTKKWDIQVSLLKTGNATLSQRQCSF